MLKLVILTGTEAGQSSAAAEAVEEQFTGTAETVGKGMVDHGISAWAETIGKDYSVIELTTLNKHTIEQLLAEHAVSVSECLCIASSDHDAAAAQDADLPVLGYERQDLPKEQRPHFPGIKYVIEELEGIDADYLRDTHTRLLGLPVTIAETGRLILREQTENDLDALYELYSSPGMEEFSTPPSEDRDAELARMKAYNTFMYGMYGFGLWMVEEKKTGQVIGRVGFGIADYGQESEIDLGYLIGRKWQRCGYAKEACMAVLRYGFEELDFEKTAVYIHPENTASLKAAAALGFVKPEEPEEAKYTDRSGRELIRMVLEKKDFTE